MKVLLLMFALVAATYSKRLFHNDQVLRLYPTEAQKAVVEQLPERYPEIDFWTAPRGNRPVDVHVSKAYVPVVKVFLTRQRINHEVFIEDVQATIDASTKSSSGAQPKNGFDYNVFHTFNEIYAWMLDIANNNQQLVTLKRYGTSYEGRPLEAMQLSKDSTANRPSFMINCGLHSREWATPASCMYAVKWLLEDSSILDTIDIFVIPVSNPDGYVHSFTRDRMWRKTRSPNAGSICVGTDPNRNWDANWSGAGASGSPCNDAYYGSAVFSEVETRAQKDFVLGLGTVQAYIDVHAYSQYWMYPYGYQSQPANDVSVLDQIGRDSVAAILSVNGKRFQTGSIINVIYQASGSSIDYYYDKAGVKCTFAAELRDQGRYGFIMPEGDILPSSQEAFAGLMVIAQAVVAGDCSSSG